ncbi:MAG: D-sedoheptulose 7-phosphate isomerase [Desulfobacterales bacterium]|jgi:D-sedoheptulose 7-phosphate isomerase
MFDRILDEHFWCFKSLAEISEAISNAGRMLIETIENGKKILICGNGGSASDAQHFAAEMVGRFTRERSAWPAVALNTDTSLMTAIANDYAYSKVFSRQVDALGVPGDTLICISTSGNSKNVIQAAVQAKTKGMQTIALVGNNGGSFSEHADIAIRVPSNITARIQEAHIFILHFWAEMIESTITLGKESS